MAVYNLKNPAVKRLMKEAEELCTMTEEYYAQPLEDNLFEWHFTIRGPPNTDFEGGIYHGRITLPPDYPMKPPSILLLTPNGRFETNKKICLSISGHHPESWQPSWSIRTALLAIIAFLPSHGNGALGSLDYTPEERKHLAIESQSYKCTECGFIKQFLKNVSTLSLNVKGNEINNEDEENQSSKCSSTVPKKKKFNVLVEDNDSDVSVIHKSSSSNEDIQSFPMEEGSLNLRKRSSAKIVNGSEKQIPKSNNSTSRSISLLLIWSIISIIIMLILRRVFYQ